MIQDELLSAIIILLKTRETLEIGLRIPKFIQSFFGHHILVRII